LLKLHLYFFYINAQSQWQSRFLFNFQTYYKIIAVDSNIDSELRNLLPSIYLFWRI